MLSVIYKNNGSPTIYNNREEITNPEGFDEYCKIVVFPNDVSQLQCIIFIYLIRQGRDRHERTKHSPKAKVILYVRL